MFKDYSFVAFCFSQVIPGRKADLHTGMGREPEGGERPRPAAACPQPLSGSREQGGALSLDGFPPGTCSQHTCCCGSLVPPPECPPPASSSAQRRPLEVLPADP